MSILNRPNTREKGLSNSDLFRYSLLLGVYVNIAGYCVGKPPGLVLGASVIAWFGGWMMAGLSHVLMRNASLRAIYLTVFILNFPGFMLKEVPPDGSIVYLKWMGANLLLFAMTPLFLRTLPIFRDARSVDPASLWDAEIDE